MIEIHAPQHDERDGDGRQGGHLVGRDVEVDRIRAFLATARTDGGALVVTGDPGVGKTGLLDAASEAAFTAGSRVIHEAGVEFEPRLDAASGADGEGGWGH